MKNPIFVLAFVFAVIGGAAAAPFDGTWYGYPLPGSVWIGLSD